MYKRQIVVNPADVPTKSSEKLRKSDAVDSGKLARSLRANELKGIYTPDSVSSVSYTHLPLIFPCSDIFDN